MSIVQITLATMMIVEDFKNVCVFAIESQSEDESTRDRSVPHTQMDTAVSTKVVPQKR